MDTDEHRSEASRRAVDQADGIMAAYRAGAITLARARAEFITLAGQFESENAVRQLPEDALSMLKEDHFIAAPPSSIDDISVFMNYCAPAMSAEQSRRADRRHRELLFRGAWTLHRLLHDRSTQSSPSE